MTPYCAYCGKEIEEKCKFCIYCGKARKILKGQQSQAQSQPQSQSELHPESRSGDKMIEEKESRPMPIKSRTKEDNKVEKRFSSEKCLYCKEIIYPGLDFQEDCSENIRKMSYDAIHNIPISAKDGKEFAGYKSFTYSKYDNRGNYMGERQQRHKTYYTKTSLVDTRNLKSLNRLKGPLCCHCMTKFLNQAIKIFESVKTKGNKKALESSMDKKRTKYMKLLQSWEKNI